MDWKRGHLTRVLLFPGTTSPSSCQDWTDDWMSSRQLQATSSYTCEMVGRPAAIIKYFASVMKLTSCMLGTSYRLWVCINRWTCCLATMGHSGLYQLFNKIAREVDMWAHTDCWSHAWSSALNTVCSPWSTSRSDTCPLTMVAHYISEAAIA